MPVRSLVVKSFSPTILLHPDLHILFVEGAAAIIFYVPGVAHHIIVKTGNGMVVFVMKGCNHFARDGGWVQPLRHHTTTMQIPVGPVTSTSI